MKKILSVMLAVIMLFGAVPFSKTAKNALGVSDANAIEAVSGSYDYLWNYIEKNGQTLDGRKIIFYSLDYQDSTALWIIFNDTTNKKIDCTYSFIGTNVTMYIGKNDSAYSVKTSDEFLGVKYNGSLSLDPKTYSKNKTYYFSLSVYDDLYEHYQDEFDSYLKTAISGWNIIMENAGISIANFGFTNAGYKTTSVPSSFATTYTVTFNANGGKVSPSSASAAAGNSVILPTPTRSGYTCLGWAASKSAKKADYRCDTAYNPNANITLYAVWEANSGTDPTPTPTPGTKTDFDIGKTIADIWDSIDKFIVSAINSIAESLGAADSAKYVNLWDSFDNLFRIIINFGIKLINTVISSIPQN